MHCDGLCLCAHATHSPVSFVPDNLNLSLISLSDDPIITAQNSIRPISPLPLFRPPKLHS